LLCPKSGLKLNKKLQILTTKPHTETQQIAQTTTEMFPGDLNAVSDEPWDILTAQRVLDFIIYLFFKFC